MRHGLHLRSCNSSRWVSIRIIAFPAPSSSTGIRSFGAGDGEKAVIQFGTPLTLLTGQNGAGKTVQAHTQAHLVGHSVQFNVRISLQTVIECLRYVTTGDQPPNTKGGAFVHDPKVSIIHISLSLYPSISHTHTHFLLLSNLQLAGERDVRAVVKLRFRDIGGHMVTCHRMLQAVQKAIHLCSTMYTRT